MPSEYEPIGLHTVRPYLIVGDADRAMSFYTDALDAVVLERIETPSGGVAHAKVGIGEAIVELPHERCSACRSLWPPHLCGTKNIQMRRRVSICGWVSGTSNTRRCRPPSRTSTAPTFRRPMAGLSSADRQRHPRRDAVVSHDDAEVTQNPSKSA